MVNRKKFKVTIRVLTKTPISPHPVVNKATAIFFQERIVGVVQLPTFANDKDAPPTQLLTDAGPFDVYESSHEVLTRIEQATE
jgi:hypothetical protein